MSLRHFRSKTHVTITHKVRSAADERIKQLEHRVVRARDRMMQNPAIRNRINPTTE